MVEMNKNSDTVWKGKSPKEAQMGPRCPGQLMPSLEIPPWLGIEPLPGMREAVGSVLRTITPSTRNKNVLCPRRLLVFPSSTFCSASSPCAVPSSFSFFASPLPFLSSHLSLFPHSLRHSLWRTCARLRVHTHYQCQTPDGMPYHSHCRGSGGETTGTDSRTTEANDPVSS